MTSVAARVAVATTSRADFGIYRPILDRLRGDRRFETGLLVTGMHLSPEFGDTIREIEASGHTISDRFEALLASDTPEGVAKSMGLTTLLAAQSFARRQPQLLVVLGDRFEMHALALAALPFRMPVAHIHGGEESEGAIDNALRHSITKLSHLHFCATQRSASRIRAMGEDPGAVMVSGAPALDAIATTALMSRRELADAFGAPADRPFLLVTYHAATLDPQKSLAELDALTAALAVQDAEIVFTLSNADVAGREINARIRSFVGRHPRARLVEHMGARGYYSAMAAADAIVGNSSSGVIEAASLKAPVVNIGDRQAGRERSSNLIDVKGEAAAITAAIEKARSPGFRALCQQTANVYGDGRAAERIIEGMAQFLARGAPVRKHFHEAVVP